jgi:Ca2+:H+ antiporter
MLRFRLTIDWLLVFVPITFALRFYPPWHQETALFLCAALAIIPLAGWMGRATEALAERMGQGMGGLLNATFGNAAELIISLVALSKGLNGVVKASLTGSIIGNILLVLGLSMTVGGMKYREQRFNRTVALSAGASLVLAAIALVIPSLFHVAAVAQPGAWSLALEQQLSLAIAVVLFATYGFTLLFSLKTHAQLFRGENDVPHAPKAEPRAKWSTAKAVTVLLVSTVCVAAMSEFLVGAIETARATLGLSEMFVGIIIVAIIGNAAEHSTAVMMAMKNKMDLSLGIAVGSSLQIALFVAPVLVFASYFLGTPLDLEFTLPEVAAVVVAVLIVNQISGDGESNWLEGVQLLSVYVILAIMFFFLPEAAPLGK